MEDQLKTLINFKKHLTKNGKVIISFFSFAYFYKNFKKQQLIREFKDKDGNDWTIKYEFSFNFIDQIIYTKIKHFCSNKLVSTTNADMRWIYKNEFELLSKLAGYKDINLHGGFERQKFTGEQELVWVIK